MAHASKCLQSCTQRTADLHASVQLVVALFQCGRLSGFVHDMTILYCGLLQSQAASKASLLDPSSRSHDAVASYELRDLPGRRLRRWLRSENDAKSWWWCWDD
jgi:hypothetical protein